MMKYVNRIALASAGAMLIASCASERGLIDRVQPRFAHKSFFVGADLQSPDDDPVFLARGTVTDGVLGVNDNGGPTEIRWQVTEHYLNAVLANSSTTQVAPNDIVASFRIAQHFDIQQEYNPSTGEVLNILSENAADRPWYDREYIRVDWQLDCNLINPATAAVDPSAFANARVAAVEPAGGTVGEPTLEAFLAYERAERRSFFVAKETMQALEGEGGAQAAACLTQREVIDRVQPDYQHKSFFVGANLHTTEDDPEFYLRSTLVDVGYGANQDGLFTSTYAQPVTRVRWEITEDFLNARLAYEWVEGTDGKGNKMAGTSYKAINDGVIVASFAIKDHFDIKRDYNPETGEVSNVVDENTSDRPWYLRQYIRVDWSANHAVKNFEFDMLAQVGVIGGVEYQPLAVSELDPNGENAPLFAPDGSYFDITQKAYASPKEIDLSMMGWGLEALPACWLDADFFGGSGAGSQCGPIELTVRTAFRRVVDTDYEPMNVDGFRFQSFGIFTQDRKGYEREYGLVDEKWYRFAARYNIWQRSHYYTDMDAMTGPVECNTRATTELGIKYVEDPGNPGTYLEEVMYDASANPNRDDNGDGTADECEAVTDATGVGGSQCDIFKKRCTLPYRLRNVQTIPWHITGMSHDADLFDTTEWATEEWDLAVRGAAQIARLVECRRTGGTNCSTEYPMWTGQQDTIDIGIRLGRDLTYCRRAAKSWSGGACEQALRDRVSELVSQGELQTEMDALANVLLGTPVFVLCHNPVDTTDHPSCGAVGTTARVGDLRFHSINIVENPQTPSPWGIMVNAVDPYWGEHISTSANIWDHVTTLATQGFVDEIRYVNGEISTAEITNGEYIRDWIGAQKSQRNATMTRQQVHSRMASMVGMSVDAFNQKLETPMPDFVRERVKPMIHEFYDVATTAEVPSQSRMTAMARMREARGTEVEATLMNPAMMQVAGLPGGLPVDGPLATAASPLAMNHPQMLSDIERRWHSAMAKQGACMIEQGPEPSTLIGIAHIMKEKFPAPANETATERQDRYDAMFRYLRTRLHYGVIAHEIGHAVGLRHNFVSSSNPLFYRPQYWQLRTKNNAVTTACTDAVADGSTCVGPRYFDPVTNEESDQLIHLFQQSSVMDYPGDVTQDTLGLGAYDFAAANFFYGDNVAVYQAPTHRLNTPVGMGLLQATDTFGGLLGIRFVKGTADLQSDTPLHYSLLAKEYRVIPVCYNVTPQAPSWWNEERDGVWHPVLDGHVVQVNGTYSKCRQLAVDYVSWKDLRMPTPAEVGHNFYRGGPSVAPDGRLRVPYGFATDRWADLGNASVYRHDNGGDAYEISQFLIQKMENRHIFDNYRRNRTNFTVRGATQRTFARYNEKLLGMAGGVGFFANIYKNYATTVGISFDSWWPEISRDTLSENAVAASMVFDHFVRQLARPQSGAHYIYNPDPTEDPQFEDVTLRSAEDADGFVSGTAMIVPNGTSAYGEDVGVGGAPLENNLEDQGEYDTEYLAYAGSYYGKINSMILMSESEDRFVSQSRGDFYDARFRASGMADAFPEGWRRVIANALTNDRSLLAPRVATDAGGLPLLDTTADTSTDPLAQLYPQQPLGWVSWWPNNGPELCFPSHGREVCRTTDDATAFDPYLPTHTRPVDPQIGWEVQKFIIAWTLAHIRENQFSPIIDQMRIYRMGLNADPGIQNRIEWRDPTSGQMYFASTYGKECLFGTGANCTGGKIVQKGIAARVLEYANELTARGYLLDEAGYPATANYPAGFNQYGRAMFVSHPDGTPVVKADPTMWQSAGGGFITPITETCNQSNPATPDCTKLDVWSNRAAVELQKYKAVPDYMWQVMVSYKLATPDQLGVYPW